MRVRISFALIALSPMLRPVAFADLIPFSFSERTTLAGACVWHSKVLAPPAARWTVAKISKRIHDDSRNSILSSTSTIVHPMLLMTARVVWRLKSPETHWRTET